MAEHQLGGMVSLCFTDRDTEVRGQATCQYEGVKGRGWIRFFLKKYFFVCFFETGVLSVTTLTVLEFIL